MEKTLPELVEPVLQHLVPLHALPASLRAQLVEKSRLSRHKSGTYVFREGDQDLEALYLLEGELELIDSEGNHSLLSADTDAARHALSPRVPVSQSGKARQAASILHIDRDLLDRMLAWSQSLPSKLAISGEDLGWLSRLAASTLFSRIPDANIRRILERMEAVPVKSGETVIRQGDAGEHYFVLRDGHCVVSRQVKDKHIRLAELKTGDSFGEEALVSGAKRNASISMLSDGTLMRLAKSDFVELIHRPAQRSVDVETAKRTVAEGGAWLDVRLPDEFKSKTLPGSINIPLPLIRRRLEELDADRNYVVFCDTGRRSAVAAFLLTEHGINAQVLDGGLRALSGSPPLKRGRRADDSSRQEAPSAADAVKTAAQLKAELAVAQQRLEQAIALKAETDAARKATEEEVARLSAADQTLPREVRDQLQTERQRFEEASRKAGELLATEQSLRLKLEAASRAAHQEATRLSAEQDTQQSRLEESLQARLRMNEDSLEADYNELCERLEQVKQEREDADQRQRQERERLEREADTAIANFERLQSEWEQARATKIAADDRLRAFDHRAREERSDLETRESVLREEAERKLRESKGRLENEFTQQVQALDELQRQKEAAEQARRDAEEEKQRLASEYEQNMRQLREETNKRLHAEREQLQRESEQIRRRLADAEQQKADAESQRQQAIRQTEQDGQANAKLQSLIMQSEEQIARANERLEAARRAEAGVRIAKNVAEEKASEVSAEEDSLRNQLEDELSDWLKADEQRVQSRDQQKTAQNDRLKEIDKIKSTVKKAEKMATDNMFDEIRSQLDND